MKEPQVVLSIRLPAAVHARVQALARAEDRSLNRMILHLLREGLQARAEPPPPA